MAFLTGPEIVRQRDLGFIDIQPFNEKNVGPNSYDVTLNPSFRIYTDSLLNVRMENESVLCRFGEEGFALKPGQLYIGSTNETATSRKFVPMFEGRSSVGRLGIFTHVTAGFGDVGWGYEKIPDSFESQSERRIPQFKHLYPTWTLEITVVKPVIVYPNMRIGQVFFVEVVGELKYYEGKYSKQRGPQISKLHKDFESE